MSKISEDWNKALELAVTNHTEASRSYPAIIAMHDHMLADPTCPDYKEAFAKFSASLKEVAALRRLLGGPADSVNWEHMAEDPFFRTRFLGRAMALAFDKARHAWHRHDLKHYYAGRGDEPAEPSPH